MSNQWLQFYQNNNRQQQPAANAETTTVVTTTTTATGNSVSNQLSRVTRPTNTRRRSRASRKTPTTLLNTDTANFRAMVQRFTGGGGGGGGEATSTHQFLNTANYNSSSLVNDGVASSHGCNEGVYNNMQFRPPYSQLQPCFPMTPVDDGGSTTARDGDDDQHMGLTQRGFYNW